MHNHSNPLQVKIEELPFSAGLKTLLTSQGLVTLQNLLDREVADWHQNIPGFTYHHQQEIINYLQEQNLTDYLKED